MHCLQYYTPNIYRMQKRGGKKYIAKKRKFQVYSPSMIPRFKIPNVTPGTYQIKLAGVLHTLTVSLDGAVSFE